MPRDGSRRPYSFPAFVADDSQMLMSEQLTLLTKVYYMAVP